MEVLRAIRAQGEPALRRAQRVLARIQLPRIDDAVLEEVEKMIAKDFDDRLL